MVDADAFRIQPWMKGLSVYRADIATPFRVLEARLDEARKQMESENELTRQKGLRFLTNNPDVRTLVVTSQYRVVRFPIAAVRSMGFDAFETPDETGHLSILGTVAEFDARAEQFIELIDIGVARILTIEECLPPLDRS